MGVCALTGRNGLFVDSHLIPKALTRPAVKGVPFVQAGMGTRPSRRWSSWYDPKLVTLAGEKILSDIDHEGIRILRECQLVWSGFSGDRPSVSDHIEMPNTPHGVRRISGANSSALRKFLLSILWRSAASTLSEFEAVTMPKGDLEELRAFVSGERETYPQEKYQISLTQIIDRGLTHNHTPLRETKPIPNLEGGEDGSVDIFRFYFDGLVVHFHIYNGQERHDLGDLAVGACDDVIATTVTYEASYQFENIRQVQDEAYRDWPDEMSKLL